MVQPISSGRTRETLTDTQELASSTHSQRSALEDETFYDQISGGADAATRFVPLESLEARELSELRDRLLGELAGPTTNDVKHADRQLLRRLDAEVEARTQRDGKGVEAPSARAVTSTPRTPAASSEPLDVWHMTSATLKSTYANVTRRLESLVDYPERKADEQARWLIEYRLNQGRVEVCSRPAHLPGGELAARHFDEQHEWLRTVKDETRSVGLGMKGGGIPALGNAIELPLMQTTLNDHEDDVPEACIPVHSADVDCVNAELVVGRAMGRWIPHVNDCNTVVAEILEKCDAAKR